MKKLIFLCVALLVAPAMAAVNFSADDNGDGTLTISYTTTDGDLPRGVALLLQVTSGDALLTGYVAASADDKMNCFIDYAYSNDPYAIGDGHPIADPAGPGALDASGGVAELSLCMGALDQTENQLPGDPEGDIATLTFTGTGLLTVSADTLRGPDSGVVGSELASNLPIVDVAIGGVPPECMMGTHPDYAMWEEYGKPNCWCYAAQCKGDVDGLTELSGTVNVFMLDLDVFVPSFGSMQTTEPGVCADLDHQKELSDTVNVFMNDLNIFVPNFGSMQDACDDTHINFWIVP
jgi:hypothetical protein